MDHMGASDGLTCTRKRFGWATWLSLRYVSLGLTRRLGAAPNMRLNAWPNALGDW